MRVKKTCDASFSGFLQPAHLWALPVSLLFACKFYSLCNSECCAYFFD